MTNAEARFNKIHIPKVYACLAVTCHLHFWQKLETINSLKPKYERVQNETAERDHRVETSEV